MLMRRAWQCVVLENNTELGPQTPNENGRQVNSLGKGRYYLIKQALNGNGGFARRDGAHTSFYALISASDNSDPNKNGRSYVLSCPCAKPVNQQCLERYEGKYLGVDAESCGFKFAHPHTLNCGAPKPSCDEYCKGLGEKRVGVALSCVSMDGAVYHCGSPKLVSAFSNHTLLH